MGGSYPVIIGAGIDENHDGKGITITQGIGKENPHITLSWSQVEKRIGELIRMDRYLNPKEKEHYPQWLEVKRNAEPKSRKRKEPEEAELLQDVKYEYHLGDNKLVFDTYDKALIENPNAKPIFHSDRGYQYTSKVFQAKLQNQGMEQSMP